MRLRNLLVVLCVLCIAGCASTPSPMWQPWTRTLASEEKVTPGSSMQIIITGETKPILGSEDLFQEKVKTALAEIFKRRGYRIVEADADYTVTLRYRTTRHENLPVNTPPPDNNGMPSIPSTNVVSYGVGFALKAAQSTDFMPVKPNTEMPYTHTVGVDIANKNADVIWKGETVWDSGNINMENVLQSTLYSLLSRLPRVSTPIPVVLTVKHDKISNFYTLFCNDRIFSCPALPYRIQFELDKKTKMPIGIEDPEVLEAYIDLIKTAEDALPLDRKGHTPAVAQRGCADNVELGGEYRLNYSNVDAHIHVLMILERQSDAYIVRRAWRANENEYNDFMKALNAWKTVLNDYYDLYEKHEGDATVLSSSRN